MEEIIIGNCDFCNSENVEVNVTKTKTNTLHCCLKCHEELKAEAEQPDFCFKCNTYYMQCGCQ